jgi:hypothetical protein
VSQLIKDKAELVQYLTNPETIPQDGLMANEGDNWGKIALKILTQCSKFKGSYYFV